MIGKRIKTLRNEKKILQKDLADQLNLSQQTISLYESDKRQPDYQTLQNIADFFNVSIDYLLGRTDIKEQMGIPVMETPSDYYASNEIIKEIDKLSPESQEDLETYLKLLKLRDMQKRNNNSSDELATLD